YLRALEMLADDPTLPVRPERLLAEGEGHSLLRAARPSERAGANDDVVRLLRQQVAAQPDATAVEAADATITFAQLDRRSSELARHLRAHGVGEEHVVALDCERSAAAVVAMFCVLEAFGGCRDVRRVEGRRRFPAPRPRFAAGPQCSNSRRGAADCGRDRCRTPDPADRWRNTRPPRGVNGFRGGG